MNKDKKVDLWKFHTFALEHTFLGGLKEVAKFGILMLLLGGGLQLRLDFWFGLPFYFLGILMLWGVLYHSIGWKETIEHLEWIDRTLLFRRMYIKQYKTKNPKFVELLKKETRPTDEEFKAALDLK